MNRTTGWFQRRRRAGTPGGLPAIGGRPRRWQRHRIQPQILALEPRWLLATIVVTNSPSPATTAASLVAAIGVADTDGTANTIDFEGFNSPETITITGGLVLSNISGTQTITGPSAALTISNGGSGSVFEVDKMVHGIALGFDDLRRLRGHSAAACTTAA